MTVHALLLPLDERPCNRLYPQMIANTNDALDLLVPDLEALGRKKQPARADRLQAFLLDAAPRADVAVLALDMLLYGGLIPSRLHHLSYEEAHERLQTVREMKRLNPSLKIYAFQCIMRAPQYDSAEEEPDYYGTYGFRLFRRRYLMDYAQRHGELSDEEQKELDGIEIPQEVIDDYEQRRAFNERMNIEALALLEEGVIDFLVIPQDDSSPYGYTAISQHRVIAELKARHLDDRVMIYPGADEVSLSLLARAYNEAMGEKPRIFPFYASVLGPTIVPNYEDRPMFESLKSHVRVVGARFAYSPEEADIILAINAPGKRMQEAFIDPGDVDITYTSYRQLGDFCERIAEFIEAGRRVAVCDSAFSNGGDRQLIERLDRMGVLDRLCSYAGWNTNCNTLGTTLSQAIIGTSRLVDNLCYRIIEDVFYQSEVRPYVVDRVLPEMGVSYYDFKGKQDQVEERIKRELQERYDALLLAKRHPARIKRVFTPWQRMFEIGMDMEVFDASANDL